ncbi:hypothetical protein GCM10022265_02820 [Marinobacter xestospongiae]
MGRAVWEAFGPAGSCCPVRQSTRLRPSPVCCRRLQRKDARHATNERIRNHFGVRRVEDLSTNQARDAIHMVEQLREPLP